MKQVLFAITLFAHGCLGQPAMETWEVKIPGFEVQEMTEVCFGPYKLPCDSGKCAIVGLEGKPSPFVHHMILRAHRGKPANTPPMLYPPPSTQCISNCDADYVYAWAMHEGANNEYEWNIPDTYGFLIGNESESQYLSLDVHFHANQTGRDESTAIGVKYIDLVDTNATPKAVHSHALMTADINIPPKQADYELCKEFEFLSDKQIEWFAQRVHTHHSGTLVETKIFRYDKLLTKRSEEPTKPQIFRNFEPNSQQNVITLQKGDILQLICHYDTTDKTEYTPLGLSMMEGEMCNHYIQYVFPSQSEDSTMRAKFSEERKCEAQHLSLFSM